MGKVKNGEKKKGRAPAEWFVGGTRSEKKGTREEKLWHKKKIKWGGENRKPLRPTVRRGHRGGNHNFYRGRGTFQKRVSQPGQTEEVSGNAHSRCMGLKKVRRVPMADTPKSPKKVDTWG